MDILVCVKQVLDPETVLQVDETGQWVTTPYEPRYQMNRFDEYAVEEAVRFKEQIGARVDVVSMGPERVLAVLQRAMGMGCGRAVHIPADDGFLPALTVASGIAAYAGDKEYDLILTGVMSEDVMQGQVGPMTAALLGRPWATSVIALEAESGGGIRVEREIEAGRREILLMKTPAVLALQSGINKPRYPTLSGLLRAKKEKPEVFLPEEPWKNGRESIVRAGAPERSRFGVRLEGGSRDKAAELIRILEEKMLWSGRAS